MKTVHTLACLFAFLILQGCALSYSASATRARVIDAQTKLPIAGANVVASWTLSKVHFGIHGSHSFYTIELFEAVTDADGWFQLPAWGPTSTPPGAPFDAQMTSAEPSIVFFKSGYAYRFVNNQERDERFPNNLKSHGVSDWNGKTIAMHRFAGTRAKYAEQLHYRANYYRGIPCQYQKTPRMLVALEREAQILDKEGVTHVITRLRQLEQTAQAQHCGSVEKFFAPYLERVEMGAARMTSGVLQRQ